LGCNEHVARLSPLLCAVVVAAVVACGHGGNLGPTVPRGATEIGGNPMTSAPPPPAGWTPHAVVPASQPQAQDAIVGYLFHEQVYKEVRQDRHPIALVCGRDVVDALRAKGYGDVSAVESWLAIAFPAEEA
jgi:hypothetical protein